MRKWIPSSYAGLWQSQYNRLHDSHFTDDGTLITSGATLFGKTTIANAIGHSNGVMLFRHIKNHPEISLVYFKNDDGYVETVGTALNSAQAIRKILRARSKTPNRQSDDSY